MPKEKDKKTINANTLYVILAVILFAIITLSVLLARDGGDAELNTPDSTIEAFEKKLSLSNYKFIDRKSWEYTSTAESTINTSQGKIEDQERIVDSVIQDPNNNDWYYLSTADRSNPDELFVAIYKYVASTRNWERIYRKTVNVTDPLEPTNAYRVLAFDNDHLIIQETPIEDGNSECFNPIIAVATDDTDLAVAPLLELDLNSPYNKWQEYSAPQNALDDYSKLESDCNLI